MEDVDYGRCWLALKAVIVSKPSHGRDALLARMSELEVESSPSVQVEVSGPASRSSNGAAPVGAAR